MIAIRTPDEIKKIAVSCKIVAIVLDALEQYVKPGVTTMELDEKAMELTREHNARAAFLNYGNPPFPAAICASINDEIVHGIPAKSRKLKEGDIVSIDFGIEKDGFYGDSARTFCVGAVSKEKKKLCDVTREALYKGIENAVNGKKLGDLSSAVQNHAESNGYSVVREFVGHGIGKKLHEDPQIPNFGKEGTGILLKSGMILAIEPMINMGTSAVKILDDNWTAVTSDGKPSAHFEHTVVVGDKKAEILTQ